MVAGVTYRPQVNQIPSVIQQAQAQECNANLQHVKKAHENGQITDISAMTQKIQFRSKLQDSKVPPVKYVEKVTPQNAQTAKVSESGHVNTPNDVTDVIKNFHNGKQYSNNERSQMLFDQMNMYAASNRILHGLF